MFEMEGRMSSTEPMVPRFESLDEGLGDEAWKQYARNQIKFGMWVVQMQTIKSTSIFVTETWRADRPSSHHSANQ